MARTNLHKMNREIKLRGLVMGGGGGREDVEEGRGDGTQGMSSDKPTHLPHLTKPNGLGWSL